MEQTIKEVAQTALPHVDQLASKLLEYLQSGMNIAQEQAPLFVNEILKWGMFENLVWSFIWILPLIVYIFTVKSFWKNVRSHISNSNWYPSQKEKEDARISFTCLNIIILVALFGITTHSLTYLAAAFKTIIAPRLYLIEYLSNLVK
ncbi:MAG: hypothetical protein ACFFBD_27780 [Candidatus Hodarchaeota archaeon]